MNFLSKAKQSAIKNKTCILRAGFDIQNKNETLRLEATLPTLNLLLKNDAKIIIIAHRGRPKKTYSLGKKVKANKDETLAVTLPYFKKNLKTQITLVSDFNLKTLKEKIKKSKPKTIFLLENIRLIKGEEKADPKLGKALSELGDFYINDDFAAAHRSNSSITEIPKHIPSYAGLLLEAEINALRRATSKPKKPFVVIVGGAKVPEKISVVGKLLPTAQTFLIGGIVATTFLKAKNLDIGKSKFDKEMIQAAQTLEKSKKIILPADYVVHNDEIQDIGPGAIKIFSTEIKKASTILWNGPMGHFEDKRFRKGSEMIARAIAKSKAFSLIGGGETTELIRELKLQKKVGFLSTGGGAMLTYLGGGAMPALEALG
ncbi:MAG: phosphoglycerate kinase [Candidatus Harrisonbacteria bacterium CG10_big_fil_rev_8_21_14_0_10_40_38]|uniref:Phosphoglycerate kinase n=1 Tax=Candidatus Harrisonbacteria bacterium CG10_big_fil_rev_8_21_14_0_10_40_38 TaxID=1974583 RepID=A0A2H0USN8_9BACT|nr:MAG: phosphoglycerate kinase [Candidatus Harrisonbacteria bacterium CG10_big_fil_rev_8_21_14_0_10_40_38]